MGHPTYHYRVIDGEVYAGIFDSDAIPPNWYDSPEKARDGSESEPVKRKPGRPPKNAA